jgi:dTDP-4-dehydrorhamnose reductase
MRVLVTGATGQLGTDVTRHCKRAGDHVLPMSRDDLDITDPVGVRSCFEALKPDLIVNCAAWTAVDACEAEPERALLLNGTAAGGVAQAAAAIGAQLVHISTDYVFDGKLNRPYRERDATQPLSAYGRSKLLGEELVLHAAPTATIVRTSWLCGDHGPNMVKTVLAMLRTDRELRFVDDQRGCPTFTADLAPLIRSLGSLGVAGVVHATNQRSVSWFEFVREIVVCVGGDPGRVTPISSTELQPPRPAPRPANSVLDNCRLDEIGIARLRDFGQALSELVSVLSSPPDGGAHTP